MFEKLFRVPGWAGCLIILAALGLSSRPAAAADKFKVITTFTVIADMASNVAGDAAEVVSITRPGADIHKYQTTPGDLVRVQGAQLALWNGLGLELWFERFFRRLKNVPGVVVTEGIEPISIDSGPYSDKPNPHAWMSPDNALVYVDNIRDALVEHDPDNAQTYQANAESYKDQIRQTIEPIRERFHNIEPDARWLATSEGAFSYMARDFDLKELYLWPINADQQGTPQQVRHVIDAIRANDVRAIFSESTVSADPARQVAREAGIRYGGVLYVDSLSAPDGPVPTYLDLLQVTTETIAKGLEP